MQRERAKLRGRPTPAQSSPQGGAARPPPVARIENYAPDHGYPEAPPSARGRDLNLVDLRGPQRGPRSSPQVNEVQIPPSSLLSLGISDQAQRDSEAYQRRRGLPVAEGRVQPNSQPEVYRGVSREEQLAQQHKLMQMEVRWEWSNPWRAVSALCRMCWARLY